MAIKDIFTFPNPVDEVSARLVGAGVVALCTTALVTHSRWLLIPLAYGYVARALTGPTFSPLNLLMARVIRPRLPIAARPIAGPPKRFAQTLAAIVTISAVALAFPLGHTTAAYALVGLMLVFAGLEAAFNFCVGCKIFGVLMKLGVVPQEVCAECANIWLRPNMRAAAPPVALAGAERAAPPDMP